jgi:hypothetical protein
LFVKPSIVAEQTLSDESAASGESDRRGALVELIADALVVHIREADRTSVALPSERSVHPFAAAVAAEGDAR